MSLQQQISEDLKAAMKARDKPRTGALRMLLASLKNRAVEQGGGPQGEVSDEEVVRLVQTETKRRREAAAAFREAGREEQAESEDAEAAIYEAYLPQQLSDEELTAVIDEAITEVGASGMSDMGQVMKTVMPRVAGQADGSRVSDVVKDRLGQQ